MSEKEKYNRYFFLLNGTTETNFISNIRDCHNEPFRKPLTEKELLDLVNTDYPGANYCYRFNPNGGRISKIVFRCRSGINKGKMVEFPLDVYCPYMVFPNNVWDPKTQTKEEN